MATIYEFLKEKLDNHNFTPIVSMHGKGTEFEAISYVEMDIDTAQWYGYIVFKDERFSPSEKGFPGLQLQYPTPDAASGVLAEIRAENHWHTLVSIFKSLMRQYVD